VGSMEKEIWGRKVPFAQPWRRQVRKILCKFIVAEMGVNGVPRRRHENRQRQFRVTGVPLTPISCCSWPLIKAATMVRN
jgi:hypothetical protein